jgi:HD-GYP domain-containing protein (c-di-GMP phosphodiesterase class II)
VYEAALSVSWERRKDETARAFQKRLRETVRAQSEQIEAFDLEMINGRAIDAEGESKGLRAHIQRVGIVSGILAQTYGHEHWAELSLATKLHDLGKVHVPREILYQDGPLTPGQRALMNEHPEEGHRRLSILSREVPRMAARIALEHHERWDGTGYPKGLVAGNISIEARIVSLADVWDAITSDRPYRRAMSWPAARKVIREGRGTAFDPLLTDVMLMLIDERQV